MKLLPWLILIIGGAVVSCGPAAKLRRAEKLIKKAEEQGAVWTVDTVYTTIPVVTTETKLDSIFIQKPGDTVILSKDVLKVKIIRLPGDSIFVEGECKSDTIYQSVPVEVTKTIEAKSWLKWWMLAIALAIGLLIGVLKR